MILPRPIRRILAVFRGGVSPVAIFLSITLGFWFGLIPGWSGFHTVIIILMLVLNVHLGLFLLSAGIGKTLCFAAAPILFHIGAGIQNYLPGLLRLLASVPIVGMTDFSRYSVAGALVVGPIIGGIAGLLMVRSVIGFRRMLLKLEEGSDKFRKWYSTRWVRILDRLLIGKRTKDAKALFTAKTKIFRKAGVALAVILLLICGAVTLLLKDTKIKEYAAARLSRANGAEVNLETLRLSVLAGYALVSGIQVTDADNPENNQIAVEQIAANASVYNLLLGKVVLDKVVVSNVRFDQKRQTPGKVVEKEAEEPKAFDPCDYKVTVADIGRLEKYLANARAVKEWLQRVRKWLPEPADEEAVEQAPIKYLDYLVARADVQPSPRLLARNVLLEGIKISSLVFGNTTISVENINDSPPAAALPIKLLVKSNDTPLEIDMTLDYSSGEQVPRVSGTFSKLDLSKLQSNLSSSAGLAFTSGLVSGQYKGLITSESVDLTVDIDVQNMQATGQGNGILGMGSKNTSEAFKVLKNLKTTIRVVGPITEPRLVFDVKGLQDSVKEALVKAGQERLSEEIDKQIDKQLDEKLGDKVPSEIKDVLKKSKGLLDGILGGKDDK